MIKDTLFMPKVMFKKCNFVKHIKNRRSYDHLFLSKKSFNGFNLFDFFSVSRIDTVLITYGLIPAFVTEFKTCETAVTRM